MGLSACTVIMSLASLAFLIWGFVMIFKKKESGEGDMKYISEQIKGFGMILLSIYIGVIGISLCLGGFGISEWRRMMM